MGIGSSYKMVVDLSRGQRQNNDRCEMSDPHCCWYNPLCAAVYIYVQLTCVNFVSVCDIISSWQRRGVAKCVSVACDIILP